jgi:hypothetical protein
LSEVEFEVAFNHFPANTANETGRSEDTGLESMTAELGFTSTWMTLETCAWVAIVDGMKTWGVATCRDVAFKANDEELCTVLAISSEAPPTAETVVFVNGAETLSANLGVRIETAIATEAVAFVNEGVLVALS